jgi:Uma2 family endonuclease
MWQSTEVSITSGFTPTPTRFNVEQFLRMDQAGIFQDHSQVELVEGELLNMAPTGAAHAFAVARLDRLIQECCLGVRRDVGRPTVYIQSTVTLSDFTALQPDIAMLLPRKDDYRRELPRPHDIGLLIVVADTSVAYDRTRKAALYALHGVVEYWLLDLGARHL